MNIGELFIKKKTKSKGIETKNVPISKFCLSAKPEIIGNMCKLEREECVTCGINVLLERLRNFAELNDGDVFAESFCFTCADASVGLIT